jgi:peptide chain release factor 3
MPARTPTPDTTTATRQLLEQAATRRTFAIISHPDAGKTTLTERLLLLSGAVQQAGAVSSRKHARGTVSDWMDLERRRGISISSTVLHFSYQGWRFNLLDTPGHADFSEDTYRTLCAADAAVMVLDAAKGLEPQTLKLFRVCRERGLPVVTFVNKCDRPALPPLELLDQIAERLGLEAVPLVWPVADGEAFTGVVDRRAGRLLRFDRSQPDRRGDPTPEPLPVAPPAPCPPDRWAALVEELELLDADGRELDVDAFRAGKQTPMLFGSALAGFGVQTLLEAFARLAPPPGPQALRDGGSRPLDAPFSALVFKVQANMDPRHRDRIAFLRVGSGEFTRGMTATLARSGRALQLKYAHQLFGQDRETVDAAVPGDIVGVVNATGLRPGDTLHAGPAAAFPTIPTFSPECFATVRNLDASRYKAFKRGLEELEEEGVVHVLRRPDLGDQEPILAGVGQLQFEVFAHRMATERNCPVEVRPAPWRLAREVPPQAAPRLAGRRGTLLVERDGRPLVLFESPFALRWTIEDLPDVPFTELGITADADGAEPG